VGFLVKRNHYLGSKGKATNRKTIGHKHFKELAVFYYGNTTEYLKRCFYNQIDQFFIVLLFNPLSGTGPNPLHF